MTALAFKQLNNGWNAEPNAPAPSITISGQDVLLRFQLNAFQYPRFSENDAGVIRFISCSRYRLGETNDEGWHLGQCRYSSLAPDWGEFYELIGSDSLADLPRDWVRLRNASVNRHFLFYFRDETFECFAFDWRIEPVAANALSRVYSQA